MPTSPSTSNNSAITVLSNTDLTACPDKCFRPVGLAFDARGRLFMSSDATGEIYVVARTADWANATSTAGILSATSSGATSTPTSGAAVDAGAKGLYVAAAALFCLFWSL